MKNVDAVERLQAYLADLHPFVHELREKGWPAEASVETVGGKMVVWVRMDCYDERIPDEAVERVDPQQKEEK